MKRKKRKSRRRERLPEPIGEIMAEDFPEFLTPAVRRKYPRHIISFQSEDGIPLHQVMTLLRIGHNKEN